MTVGAGLPVAIFARNEEDHIVSCLDSIQTPGVRIYVLANGCTDNTEAVVRRYMERRDEVELVSIATADRANAWNVFIHEVAPEADCYVFAHGNVRFGPNACGKLQHALRNARHANAAAGVPAAGRSRCLLTRMVVKDRLILWGLYALSGRFVERLRACRVRMPVGYVNDDGFVTSFAKWDGDPATGWDPYRVMPVARAQFEYSSLSLGHPVDWITYWHRRVRQSLGYVQDALLCEALEDGGLAAVPARVEELYRRATALSIQHRRHTLFDHVARRKILRLREAAS